MRVSLEMTVLQHPKIPNDSCSMHSAVSECHRRFLIHQSLLLGVHKQHQLSLGIVDLQSVFQHPGAYIHQTGDQLSPEAGIIHWAPWDKLVIELKIACIFVVLQAVAANDALHGPSVHVEDDGAKYRPLRDATDQRVCIRSVISYLYIEMTL